MQMCVQTFGHVMTHNCCTRTLRISPPSTKLVEQIQYFHTLGCEQVPMVVLGPPL